MVTPSGAVERGDQSKTRSPRCVRFNSATSEWASVATAFHNATASSPLGAFGITGPKKLRCCLGAGTDGDDRRPDVATGALEAVVRLCSDHGVVRLVIDVVGVARSRGRRRSGIRWRSARTSAYASSRRRCTCNSVPKAVYSLPTASLPSRSRTSCSTRISLSAARSRAMRHGVRRSSLSLVEEVQRDEPPTDVSARSLCTFSDPARRDPAPWADWVEEELGVVGGRLCIGSLMSTVYRARPSPNRSGGERPRSLPHRPTGSPSADLSLNGRRPLTRSAALGCHSKLRSGRSLVPRTSRSGRPA